MCCKVIEPGDRVKVVDFRDNDCGKQGTAVAVELAEDACARLGLQYFGRPGVMQITVKIGRSAIERTFSPRDLDKVCGH